MYRFGETHELDRIATRAALGAAVVAAAALPGLLAPALALRFGGPAVMALAAGGLTRIGARAAAMGLLAALTPFAWPGHPGFADAVAGLLAGGALGLVVEASRRRAGLEPSRWPFRAALGALAAVTWPLALQAVTAARASALAQSWVPPTVLTTLVAAAGGLALALCTAPLFLEAAADRVGEALRQAKPVLDGELRALVLKIVEARGRATRLLAQTRADGARETQRALDGLALAAIELADRFGAVDRVLSRQPLEAVEARLRVVVEQRETTEDSAVRRDLDRARETLEEQRAQVQALRQGRARLLARLECEHASLERTEMSLALLASGDAAMSGLKLEALGTTLGRRAADLAAEGAALQETLAGTPAQALHRVAAS